MDRAVVVNGLVARKLMHFAILNHKSEACISWHRPVILKDDLGELRSIFHLFSFASEVLGKGDVVSGGVIYLLRGLFKSHLDVLESWNDDSLS